MSVQGLLPPLSLSAEYRSLLKLLGAQKARGRLVLLDSALPYCAAALREDLGIPILVLTAKPERACRLYEDLLTWCGENTEVHQFPEGETLPFERLMADEATTHTRIATLHAMLDAKDGQRRPPLVIASLAAVAQRTLLQDTFENARHYVSVGQSVNVGTLMERWQRMGYRVERAAEVPGTVSRRGGILDIYSPGSELPARIELVGDVVESMRLFEPGSQRSVRTVDRVLVLPTQESLPGLISREEVEDRYRYLDMSNCTPAVQARIQEEMTMLLEGHAVEEHGLYQGFFCQGSIMDFLPNNALLVVEKPGDMEEEGPRMDERARELREVKEERGEIPRNFPSLQTPWRDLTDRFAALSRRLEVAPWAQAGDGDVRSIDMGFVPPNGYWGNLDSLAKDIKEWHQDGDRVVIVSHHAARLAEVLQQQGIPVQVAGTIPNDSEKGHVSLIGGALTEGWALSSTSSTLRLLTDVEVMGRAKERPLRRRAHVQRAAFLSELEPGSYLVHTEHGIGRFVGTRHIEAGDGEREYLVLEYAEGDKLYVPADQLDRVGPYVAPGERTPTITRLGTQEWSRTKERARASTRELARELLALYASREIGDGISFSADTPWQKEMEDSFPYQETSDQLDSILEVKRDMEQPTPMDRLVCGDVGYGKTEIALRAAFKAVMDGLQVAVLVPTTVLAQQHYVTFSERLAPFPLKVEALSRFRTDEEQRNIVEGLESGEVDICIGTHRLLQKDVSFKKLGLVIVDEEQRFGVSHKERLKDMRKEVDVLTLSATPIPRTLHMAMAGIRDMSTIETPPEERLAIKTYLSEYSDEVVREAILRELDRGGQAFFLHNRVRTIEETAEKIRSIVPEATVAVGHGQMPEDSLEQVMGDFAQEKYDVLVCTTIIEAGLDLPNVNTIIIDRADMLGLSQLYQLRGRIGRGVNRAYAYLMVPRNRRITETAEKRLKTILAATELGAGFRIAMRDLEIRGAGNLLGREQSGHIHAVGYDLYSQLLSHAVEELRALRDGGSPDGRLEETDVQVDLPLSAYIPLQYIPDLPTRLGVYQRLARRQDLDAISSLAEEVRDRFGPMPQPVENLLYVVRLKAQAREVGVESIAQDGRSIVVRLRDPIGGAQFPLQRALGRAVQVGHSQIRLPIRSEWQSTLPDALDRLAAFKARVLELSSAG